MSRRYECPTHYADLDQLYDGNYKEKYVKKRISFYNVWVLKSYIKSSKELFVLTNGKLSLYEIVLLFWMQNSMQSEYHTLWYISWSSRVFNGSFNWNLRSSY
jgi:hypothetical protein